MRFGEKSKPSDFAPLDNPIYLVPPQSKRYVFRKKRNKEFKDTLNEPMLKINTSQDMLQFIQLYSKKIIIFGDIKQGVIDWSALKDKYHGIEFKWYKPFYSVNNALKNTIFEHDVLEFYCNLVEPCGFVFSP